ncbi:hypothetical protein JJL45_09115 [Tamlana sp. s12]|uniref:hypothetical protein n=1 Tax=Tamlana sp. s12 TaxID=1630406 RepID=UPI0008023186|nr:hypothetical protein [Tamlana sp. s12]OBQ52884.1 hypothetical protein VQ01_13125 [Tamlana sp. s12]QQY81089.1 hypothetical protein JJL45_09115 [Tamlana sp. s12]
MKENYYIIIKNNYYQHDCDKFHIEKIFSKETILKVINEEILEQIDNNSFTSSFDKYLPKILTNDIEFLQKYLFAINFEELKMLSNVDNFKNNEIRINKSYFYNYNEDVYKYCTKIINGEIISANEYWSSMQLDRTYLGNGEFNFSQNTGRGELIENYSGWRENIYFEYFKTPKKYLKEYSGQEIFRTKDIRITNIEELNEILNVSILDLNDNSKNLILKDNFYCYFDPISQKKLFLPKESLKYLLKYDDVKVKINIKFDENFTIEYHVYSLSRKIIK